MSNPILRISTRGYYDLSSGKTLKTNPYFVYPKRDFKKIINSNEVTIMIHGLRNDSAGAIAKVILAKKRLGKLGYAWPVIGFSYDSNTTGAHLIKHERHALAVGQMIAKKNGRNLGSFIEDFHNQSPKTKIRLIGHSLGTLVILHTIKHLAKKIQNQDIIESIHLFGASIEADSFSLKNYGKDSQNIVRKKILNYYAPTDEVLGWAVDKRYVSSCLGLCGAIKTPIPKYHQKLTKPQNHRFASYAATLLSFP